MNPFSAHRTAVAAACAALLFAPRSVHAETEEFTVTMDAQNIELPAHTNHFKARDGQDAPVGWYVQRCVSGYDDEGGIHIDKFAPPVTNTGEDIDGDGVEVYGHYLTFYGHMNRSNSMEFMPGTTWMGDRRSASVYADTGMPGFVTAMIAHTDVGRHGWLRAFSASTITGAAYYGDARKANTALDFGGQINYEWNPRDPAVSNVNPAYLIPFGVTAPVDGQDSGAPAMTVAFTGTVCSSASGANNQLSDGIVSVHWRNVTLNTGGWLSVADGQWIGALPLSNASPLRVTNVFVCFALAASERPGLPSSPAVTISYLNMPEPLFGLLPFAALLLLGMRTGRADHALVKCDISREDC